jgi:hypothetical protein
MIASRKHVPSAVLNPRRYSMNQAVGRGEFWYGTKEGHVERGLCVLGALAGRFVLRRSGFGN